MAEADDERQKAKRRFHCIVGNLLVEGTVGDGKSAKNSTSEVNEVVAQAIKTLQNAEDNSTPKYFKGESDVMAAQGVITKIDGIANGEAAADTDADTHLRMLYSDFLYLCVALKPRPGMVPTLEDSNFCAKQVERLFEAASEDIQIESLEDLGRTIDMILEEGTDELGSSPAKLRLVLMALAHPKLADPCLEPWTVLKKCLKLIRRLHSDIPTRDILVQWFAKMPFALLENYVSQLQTFLTVSLLMAQSEHPNITAQGQPALRAVAELSRNGDLGRHTRNALSLMDLFWRANEIRRDLGHDWRTRMRSRRAKQQGQEFDEEPVKVMDIAQFHNDAINECEVLVKHDLGKTLEAQSKNVRGGLSNVDDAQRSDFGVIEFPFVLTAVSKVRLLNIESMVIQRDEVRTAMLSQMMTGQRLSSPYLVLKIRRTDIIQDALQKLAQQPPEQLKKPLKIVFDGEEGVDEGGVQKEFFQILIEQLYNKDFGMFESVDETNNLWFNKNCFEVNLQFELFGKLLGLAIYNQVILDVKFPGALYKKLMIDKDAQIGLSDLLDFQPSLAQGLIALLEFDPACGTSFEDTFGDIKFVVEYDCFGSVVEVELKQGGKDIAVSLENREDYVQRYCDWIFSTGVAPQFKAFRSGFDKCISDTLFRQLFRPDELELIICGTEELDFEALEKTSQYQDGYTKDTAVVKWFWEVVHSLGPGDKKLFLQFCTGCDRAPVGGLGRIPFIVSRAGPHGDSLPTVHTCFNHVLIPEYESKEKLEQCIRLAIQHSTGFGLI